MYDAKVRASLLLELVVEGLWVHARYNIKMPRYNQIVNALTWMSHSQNLRRVAREHPIDLYLQPPVTRYRLLDYHLMDRIVRDSNRCATAACFQSTVCSMQHPPCRDACIFEADVYYLGCCFSPCMVAVMVFR